MFIPLELIIASVSTFVCGFLLMLAYAAMLIAELINPAYHISLVVHLIIGAVVGKMFRIHDTFLASFFTNGKK